MGGGHKNRKKARYMQGATSQIPTSSQTESALSEKVLFCPRSKWKPEFLRRAMTKCYWISKQEMIHRVLNLSSSTVFSKSSVVLHMLSKYWYFLPLYLTRCDSCKTHFFPSQFLAYIDHYKDKSSKAFLCFWCVISLLSVKV